MPFRLYSLLWGTADIIAFMPKNLNGEMKNSFIIAYYSYSIGFLDLATP
jgi:hypothetical protein